MISLDSTTITYDALGRMVEKNVSGTYTQIVYGPGGGKFAVMSGQTLQKAFIPLPTGATAVYTSAGLAYYRHSDHLGSSRLATTPSRTLYSSTAYAPFGEPYAEAGATDRSFTGKDEDTTSGMYDFLERRYNPTAGRWLSPDPAGLGAVDPTNPQTWNRYAYVGNNPLALVDFLGEDYGYIDNTAYGWENNLALGGGWDDPFATMLADPQTITVHGDENGDPYTKTITIYGLSVLDAGVPPFPPDQFSGGGLPTLPDPPLPKPPVVCQPDVIQAMRTSWSQSSNGTSGNEAGFTLNGSADHYWIQQQYTNESHKMTISIRTPGMPLPTFALIHVHPAGGGAYPSTPGNNWEGNGLGDTGIADKYRIDVYVISQLGLTMYDPATGLSTMLRRGLDWTRPCR